MILHYKQLLKRQLCAIRRSPIRHRNLSRLLFWALLLIPGHKLVYIRVVKSLSININ